MDEDYTSYIMNRINLYKHQQRINEIRHRKNTFLPRIKSNQNMIKPKRNINKDRKIEEENFKIFKRLLEIDHRLPLLSEKKNLSKKYINVMKKGRNELNLLESNMMANSRKINYIKIKKMKLKLKLKTNNNYFNIYLF